MSGTTARWLAMRLGALGIAMAVGGGLVAGTAAADPAPSTTTSVPAPPTTTGSSPTPPTGEPNQGSGVRVTAVLDKQLYRADDVVRLTVTVTNDGPDTAFGVTGAGSGGLDVGDTWGEAGSHPGINLEPGATRVIELSGHIVATSDASFGYSVNVFPFGSFDPNPDNNSTSVSASIVRETTSFGGVIFTDSNVNGVLDPDESGLDGVNVHISGGTPFVSLDQTTDVQGRFSFPTIPTGQYFISYAANGWDVLGLNGSGFDVVEFDTSGRYADVRIPAVRPLFNSLEVSMRFDANVYQPGETARLTVVLVNRGRNALTGVTAHCFGGPDSPNLRGGAGWGPLAPGAGGLTIPPGKQFSGTTAVVRVSEQVPEASPRFGYVSGFCDFTATGYSTSRPVFSRPGNAQVAGLPASGGGRVFEDRNSNGSLDDGEQLAGVTVVITDPNTGVAVARPVTDADGAFAVDGVPASEYDLRVAGPWKPRFEFGGGWFRFPLVAGSAGVQQFGVVSAPEQQNNRPNLRVSATLDKTAYNSGDVVHSRITVTNIGEVAAEGVRAGFGGGPPSLAVDTWGELEPFGPGARVEAGATRVFDVDGFIPDADAGFVLFGSTLTTSNGEINTSNNTFVVAASVTKTFGNYAGVVFGDRNANGRLDRGEELPGARVSISARANGSAFSQLTDAHGRFAFNQVPTGRYFVSFDVPDKWVVRSTTVQLDETDDPDGLIRGVRPLSDTLSVTMTFNERRYRVGDTVHLTVTLKNSGRTPVEHIRAWCNGVGNSNVLNGDAEGWGPLRSTTDGVTVRPGQTKTIRVTDTVPAGANDFGYVEAACAFSADLTDGPPRALDTANIIGRAGDAQGRLVQDANGDGDFSEPVANTRVALLLPGTHRPVGFATTDADGNFDITGLPARHYDVKLLGPWKFAPDEEFPFLFVHSGSFNPGRRWFHVVPR